MNPVRKCAWLLIFLTPLLGCDEQTIKLSAPQVPLDLEPHALFAARCAGCHENSAPSRTPSKQAMAKLNATNVAFTLLNGNMKTHAEGLTQTQIFDLAGYVAGTDGLWTPDQENFCTNRSVSQRILVSRWGVDDANRGASGNGLSTITSKNVAKLSLAWVFGLPDTSDARSQPVATDDTLFIAATGGHLLALDLRLGCIKWHTHSPAPPRTSLALGHVLGINEDNNVLFYGDAQARTQAVDTRSGKVLWRTSTKISEHSLLTGAPVLSNNLLIVPISSYEVALALDDSYECCRSHGGVLALDARTGERIWQFATTIPATKKGTTAAGTMRWGPSGVPVWSTPTIDAKRQLIYLGTGQNASAPSTNLSDSVIALNLKTGELAWHFQALAGDTYNMACDTTPKGANCPKWSGPDHDIGASIILTTTRNGREVLLVGQKSGDVYALDPDNQGNLLWHTRPGAGSALGGVHWGLAVDGNRLFVPISDPPFPFPGYFPKPGLFALAVDSGDTIWHTPVQRECETTLYEYFGRNTLYPDCPFYFALSAAPMIVNDLVFAGALDGVMRAFEQHNGNVAWSFNTLKAFKNTTNGIATHGGSIDVTAPLSIGDMVYVQSGYSQFGQLPGNALLAFRLSPSL